MRISRCLPNVEVAPWNGVHWPALRKKTMLDGYLVSVNNAGYLVSLGGVHGIAVNNDNHWFVKTIMRIVNP